MSLVVRTLRQHRGHIANLTPLPVRPRIHHPRTSSQPTRQSHSRASAPPTKTTTYASRPLHSAADPATLLIAAIVSVGIAYFGATYGGHSQEHAEEQHGEEKVVVAASDWEGRYSVIDVMGPQPLPGRPGNLTPEQEAKLKDMWAQSLEFFGMSHEDVQKAQSNGTLYPRATPESPERKKKRGLMSRFRKDKTEEADTENGVDNDKHGQFKEFEQALASMKPEEIREAFWNMTKHDHPDAILLRFLRARKWDIHAATVMSLSTLHWRLQDAHVDDDIMARGEEHALKQSDSDNAAERKEGEDFLVQYRMGKSFLHGLDKAGHPCCYVRARLHRAGEQSTESLERYTIHTIETTRMLLKPPVDTATIIFDLTDFSMANMDYAPVKFMIKIFEANYPESLGSVLVYKAPWIFQGIWKIVRGWLDPVVAAKVHFAGNLQELEEYISKSSIIKELGGDSDWTYQYAEPKEGENAQMQDTAARDKLLEERKEYTKEYEKETLAWIQGDDSKKESRDRIAQQLAENYWKLDPYLRARSLYDRTGIIGPMGKLDFYPPEKKIESTADDDLD